MDQSRRRNSRKSKHETRNVDSVDDEIFAMQESLQLELANIVGIDLNKVKQSKVQENAYFDKDNLDFISNYSAESPNSSPKNELPNIEFSVNVEVENLSDTEKEITDKELLPVLLDLRRKQVTIGLAVIYLRNEEELYEEIKEISKVSRMPVDKYLEIQALNLKGRTSHPIARDKYDIMLQEVFDMWRLWIVGSKFREAPMCYKCYICNKAWWRLTPFKEHTRSHKEDDFKITGEPINNEFNVVCYTGDDKPQTSIRIEGNCPKCQKPHLYHFLNTAHRTKPYQCKGCKHGFQTCSILKFHEGLCALTKKMKYQQAIARRQKVSEDKKCHLCDFRAITEQEMEEHLNFMHLVPSDVPVHSFKRQCLQCGDLMVTPSLHVCRSFRKQYNQCKFCWRVFGPRSELKIHQTISGKPVVCSHCNTVLPKQCMELEHMTTHSMIYCKMVKCLDCPPICLYTSGGFKRHKFYHSEGHRDLAKNCLFEIVIVPKTMLKLLKYAISENIKQIQKKLEIKDDKTDDSNQIIDLEEEMIAETNKYQKNYDKREFSADNDLQEDYEAMIQVFEAKANESNEFLAENVVVYEIDDDDETKAEIERNDGDKISLNDETDAVDEMSLIHDTNAVDETSLDHKRNVDETSLHHVNNAVDESLNHETNAVDVTSSDHETHTVAVMSLNHERNTVDETSLDREMNVANEINDVNETKMISEINEDDDLILVANTNEVVVIDDSDNEINNEHLSEEVNIKMEVVDENETNLMMDEDNEPNLIIDESIEIKAEQIDPSDQFNVIEYVESSFAKQETTDHQLDLKMEYDSSDLKIIEKIKNKGKKYNCKKKCGFVGSRAKFLQHYRKCQYITSNRIIHCTKCKLDYPGMKIYLSHLTAHGFKEDQCPDCFLISQDWMKLSNHLNQHARQLFVKYNSISEERSTSKNIFWCKKCEERLTKADFFVHWEKHLSFKKPGIKDDLKVPKNESDVIDTQVPVEVLRIDNKCILSAKVLRRVIDLLHLDNGRRNNLIIKVCFICKKRFNRMHDSKRHLIEHLLNHAMHVDAEWQTHGLKCQICSELFPKSLEYKHHMRVHAGLPIYKCSICHKTFSDSSNFVKHKKVHGIFVGYICDICKKKFQSKVMLEAHIKLHMSQGVLKCAQCTKTFNLATEYRRHTRVAHKPKAMSCKLCSNKFSSLKAKWDHEWTVHKNRRIKADCPICEMSFRKFVDVKNHIKDAHKNVVLDGILLKYKVNSTGKDRSYNLFMVE